MNNVRAFHSLFENEKSLLVKNKNKMANIEKLKKFLEFRK